MSSGWKGHLFGLDSVPLRLYFVAIHDVLFVPSLTANLFAPNTSAMEHRDTYPEVTYFPQRIWVNRQAGATGFTSLQNIARSSLLLPMVKYYSTLPPGAPKPTGGSTRQ
jgi:hypothetical protein